MTDPNFERSLRAAARRGRPGGVHPDASLLAAYVDRGLNDAERAELEGHVADCAECMERLALLGSVNVPDEPGAPAIEWSPRQLLSRWGWLVPVATVVVLVAVWERQPAAPPHAPAAPEVAEKPAGAPAAAEPHASNQPAESDERARILIPDGGSAREELQKAPARQVAQAPKAKDASVRPEMQANARAASPQFGAPATPDASADASRLRDKKQVDALGPVASNKLAIRAAPAAAPAPAAPPAQAEAAAAVGGRADEAKAGNETRPTIKAMPESIAQGALLKSEVAAPLLLATGDAVMIRLLGTRIERSTDRGASWTLDLPDAPAGLHAGSCPSAVVCWVGGSQGTVMVRQASGAWTRHVVADGRAAVTAIEATDATTARVRLSDGRSFHTSDAGATWVEVARSGQ